MKNQFLGTEVIRTFIFALFVGSVFILFNMFQFGDLQILSEARGYIHYGGYIRKYSRFFEYIFVPEGWNTRGVSMLSFLFMKKVCGYDSYCINLFQLVVLTTGGVILFVHSLQLFKNKWQAGFVLCCWYFSLPVMDSICWQATNHDKMAAIFIFSILCVTFYLFNLEGLIVNALSNVGITFLLLLAYNSKEVSFFLTPLIIAQYFFYSSNFRNFCQKLKMLVVPIVFSIYFIGVYFYKIPAFWKEHTLSNSIETTIKIFASFLLNSREYRLIHLLVLLVFLLLPIVIMLVKYFKHRSLLFEADLYKQLAYLYMFFLMSMLVVTKTRYPSEYYLLVPLGAFLLLMVSLHNVIRRDILKGTRLGQKILSIIVVCFLFSQIVNYIGLYDVKSKYMRLNESSNNFRQTFEEISQKFPLSYTKNYFFYYPEKIKNSLLLSGSIGENGNKTLINFIYGVGGDFVVHYVPYHTRNDIISITKNDGDYYIFIDQDYNLIDGL